MCEPISSEQAEGERVWHCASVIPPPPYRFFFFLPAITPELELYSLYFTSEASVSKMTICFIKDTFNSVTLFHVLLLDAAVLLQWEKHLVS